MNALRLSFFVWFSSFYAVHVFAADPMVVEEESEIEETEVGDWMGLTTRNSLYPIFPTPHNESDDFSSDEEKSLKNAIMGENWFAAPPQAANSPSSKGPELLVGGNESASNQTEPLSDAKNEEKVNPEVLLPGDSNNKNDYLLVTDIALTETAAADSKEENLVKPLDVSDIPEDFAKFLASLSRGEPVFLPPESLSPELLSIWRESHTFFPAMVMGAGLVLSGTSASLQLNMPSLMTTAAQGAVVLWAGYEKHKITSEALSRRIKLGDEVINFPVLNAKHWREILANVTWIKMKFTGGLEMGNDKKPSLALCNVFGRTHHVASNTDRGPFCLTTDALGVIDISDLNDSTKKSLFIKEDPLGYRGWLRSDGGRAIMVALVFGLVQTCHTYIHDYDLQKYSLIPLMMLLPLILIPSGEKLRLNLTEEFLGRLTKAVQKSDLTIIFSDAVAEKYRGTFENFPGKTVFMWPDNFGNLGMSFKRPWLNDKCVEVNFPKKHQD